jgi:hypothetical protein
MFCVSAWMACALCGAALETRAGWAQAAPAAQPAQPAGQNASGAPAGTDQDSNPLASGPLAIVPVSANDPGGAATVTGALAVAGGKAMIGAGGSITSGPRTTEVVLPHRGVLRVCASTTVKLAADSSVPAGETPGLLMAVDHGAVELSLATTPEAGSNADILLTPDFHILIAGPGSSDLKVRLGEGGDTCVDNSGASAPYVVVTSLFDAGLYRVQPGQRVMFQHGSLSEVVDSEKEPCGCPPASAESGGNDFPLAQSEGLAPTPATAPAPPASGAATVGPLVYSSPGSSPGSNPASSPANAATPNAANAQTAAQAPPASAPAAGQASQAQAKRPGFFTRVGRFFKKIFGAE